jgi:dipeptidyl aminopeptidase/acylaminoacyl peptidase
MTANGSFDRRLTTWLEADAQGRVADHLAQVLVTTRATRQRPAWSSLERWLPVDFAVRETWLGLSRGSRLLLVGLLILVIAAVTILAVGSVQPLLSPMAPGRNGLLIYESAGDIVAFDPSTRHTTTIVPGPEVDRDPHVSPDGTKVAFVREVADSRVQIMQVEIGGTGLRILGVPLDAVDNVVWSPDGSRLAVDADIGGEVAIRLVVASSVSVITRHDDGSRISAVNDLQWLPHNSGLVFRGWDVDQGLFGLWAVRFDGTNLRQVLPGNGDRRELVSLSVAPDGKSVAYVFVDEARIRLVELATGNDRALTFDGADASGGDRYPVWSPDGSRLAFERTEGLNRVRVVVGSSAGGAVVETGPAFSASSPPRLAFSPDGSRLIAFDPVESAIWILDVTGGAADQLPSTAGDLPSWQSLVP